MLSVLKSIIKWLLVAIFTLFLGGVTALFIFKDRIVKQVLIEVNKSLKVPVEVSRVDLDFFHGFPKVSVAFYDVILPAKGETIFIQAKRFYVLLNPVEVIQGNLDIDRIEIIDAKINILVDKNNRNNVVEIFQTQAEDRTDKSTNIEEFESKFNLNSILLKNVEVNYQNLFTGAHEQWFIKRAEGDLSLLDKVYSSRISGKLTLKKFATRKWQSHRSRDLELDLNISYNTLNKHLSIHKSIIEHVGASFLVDGEVSFLDILEIELVVDGEQVNFKLLTSFLPPKYEKIIKKYQGSGSIDFNAELSGHASSTKLPSLDIDLQLSKVDLKDESFDASINDLYLRAFLHFDDIGDVSTGSIKITSAKGLLRDQPFEFNLSISNFVSPKYEGQFKGNISTNWLLANIKFPYHETGEGDITVDLTASGAFDQKGILKESEVNGAFNLKEISFQWADTISIDKIDGVVQFDGDMIMLNNVILNWLRSDVTISGSVQNIQFTDSISGNLRLRSDVKSHYLAIEDIVALIRNAPEIGDSSVNKKYGIDLELLCLFDSLSFKRFRGSNLAGEITLQDNILELVDINGKAMGGAIKLNGQLKLMPNKDIYISANALTKSIYLDSLFYVFNNFAQQFITNENLKGLLYADVFASMYFDSTWRFRRPLLTSMAKLRVVNGELNDFEPIMALSEYINDKNDNLSKLRFSHLVNYISIREDTVFIPEMSIQTNVRNIALAGYHTLDQHINYRLAVPIINERVDKDEAFGAVQKSSKGSPNLLFRIKGTTTDYKVNYDLLRATGNVLKLLDITRIFKKKQENQIDSTFLDDEDFDWEN